MDGRWLIFQTRKPSSHEIESLSRMLKKTFFVSAAGGACGCEIQSERKRDFEDRIVNVPEEVAESNRESFERQIKTIIEFRFYLESVSAISEIEIYNNWGSQIFEIPEIRKEISPSFFDPEEFQWEKKTILIIRKKA